MSKLQDFSNYQDFTAINKLRTEAQQKGQERETLLKVSKQFEGIFMQMLMKSMRDANAVFEQDNPLNSNYTKFYRDMHDQQLTSELSQQGSLGLAEMMVEQLMPGGNTLPASLVERKGVTVTQPEALRNIRQATAEQRSAASQPAEPLTTKPSSGKVSPMAPQFDSPESFVKAMLPEAKRVAAALGTQPEAILAQAALETGWGQKVIRQNDGSSSHNLFNIKADSRWQGDKASTSTLEFEQGVAVKRNAAFRSYDSFADSFNDYLDFLKNSPRYQNVINQSLNPARFLQGLQEAGYATDPNYASKAISLVSKIAGWLDQ